MRNVLSANFLRLKHSRILWLCLAYMLYDGLRLFYSASQAAAGTGTRMAPSFQFFWLGGIVFAVYCSFFISGEYGEGGVRRKVAAGAPRPAVYLANLTSCTLASLLMCGGYILANWTLEYFVLGGTGVLEYTQTPGQIALLLLRSSSPDRYSFSPLEELRYRLFAEWLPGGQAIHCVSLGAFWAPESMMLRALAVIAVSTGVGICLFRRKDLK